MYKSTFKKGKWVQCKKLCGNVIVAKYDYKLSDTEHVVIDECGVSRIVTDVTEIPKQLAKAMAKSDGIKVQKKAHNSRVLKMNFLTKRLDDLLGVDITDDVIEKIGFTISKLSEL